MTDTSAPHSAAPSYFPFDITAEALGDVSVLRLRGELDIVSARLLRETAAQITAVRPAQLALELSELTFCDAAGLGAFVSCRLAVERRGGRLWLAATPPKIAKLLVLTGLNHHFTSLLDLSPLRA